MAPSNLWLLGVIARELLPLTSIRGDTRGYAGVVPLPGLPSHHENQIAIPKRKVHQL